MEDQPFNTEIGSAYERLDHLAQARADRRAIRELVDRLEREQETMRQHNQELQRSNKLLEHFASLVSHDLRPRRHSASKKPLHSLAAERSDRGSMAQSPRPGGGLRPRCHSASKKPPVRDTVFATAVNRSPQGVAAGIDL
ncbi:MAG: hypothetical protein PVF47_14990 [Anaerolineae bacterium]|jgi:hypothetical protein